MFISQELEYRGVMRFFFQDAGAKMATKCIRVTSLETADDVTRTLVEKFRPDMKMLTNPNYSLYEVHPNGGKLWTSRSLPNELLCTGLDILSDVARFITALMDF